MSTPEKISALADFIEQLHPTYAAMAALPDHEWETVHSQLLPVLKTVEGRLVRYLAYTDDMLVGAEYCDECGEVEGTVVRVDREPDLTIITDKGDDIYLQDVRHGRYFRLPGSKLCGGCALVELARARVSQTEKHQPFVPA